MNDECDEIDRADLRREAKRKTSSYCPECECYGHHATGCPETPEDSEDYPSEDTADES